MEYCVKNEKEDFPISWGMCFLSVLFKYLSYTVAAE